MLLGLGGLLASLIGVMVGLVTYCLAARRARRNRWEVAKHTVLRDLSKSLGEGRVPQAPVIQATINSVLRGQDAPDLTVVALDHVVDDLLRQVTADPFLDPIRRMQLQDELVALKTSREGGPPETVAGRPPGGPSRGVSVELRIAPAVMGILSGTLVAIASGVMLKEALPRIVELVRRFVAP